MEYTSLYSKYLLCLLLGVIFSSAENLRPIIGILSQEPSSSMLAGDEDKNYQSYIAASYVKFVESAGARVVPIWINQEESYYQNIADSVNGILFPGGGNSIRNDSGYGMAGQILYGKILEKNAAGTYLPLWATCLGFEMLFYLASGYTSWLTSCQASNLALPLELEPGYSNSRLFENMPADVVDIFATQNVTSHFHKWCYTKENFNQLLLDQSYNILALNHDEVGMEFISVTEHKILPIFGTQWHPEKNAYEWKNDATHDTIPHWDDAVYATKYYTDFFISNARLNDQSFASEAEEESMLIYQYKPKYVGNTTSSFLQVYLFDQL